MKNAAFEFFFICFINEIIQRDSLENMSRQEKREEFLSCYYNLTIGGAIWKLHLPSKHSNILLETLQFIADKIQISPIINENYTLHYEFIFAWIKTIFFFFIKKTNKFRIRSKKKRKT